MHELRQHLAMGLRRQSAQRSLRLLQGIALGTESGIAQARAAWCEGLTAIAVGTLAFVVSPVAVVSVIAAVTATPASL
jgi:hypothetical protein